MTSFLTTPIISWQKLPDDFQLPDDPVDNINQPPLAAALTDLEIKLPFQKHQVFAQERGFNKTAIAPNPVEASVGVGNTDPQTP